MQPEVDVLRFEASQQSTPGRPGRTSYHAADGLDTTHIGEPQRGLVDATVQAEIVDGDADRAPTAMLRASMRKLGIRRSRGPERGTRRGRIGRFIAVGCAAAAVHWVIVVVLVSGWGWRPLVANVLGWLAAFTLSFTGHHRLTFGGHGVPVRSSAARFFAVSAGGFGVNEITYALMLRWSSQRYDLILAVVLIAVAALTYLLGRHWVFLRSEVI